MIIVIYAQKGRGDLNRFILYRFEKWASGVPEGTASIFGANRSGRTPDKLTLNLYPELQFWLKPKNHHTILWYKYLLGDVLQTR